MFQHESLINRYHPTKSIRVNTFTFPSHRVSNNSNNLKSLVLVNCKYLIHLINIVVIAVNAKNFLPRPMRLIKHGGYARAGIVNTLMKIKGGKETERRKKEILSARGRQSASFAFPLANYGV